METLKIDNWSEFISTIDELRGDWVFRGQSDNTWPLETTLYRFFDSLQKQTQKPNLKIRPKAEQLMLEEFRRSSSLYMDKEPEVTNILEWFSLMQHHGAPTRMLDATCSPYIALFFALESGTKDAAVFAMRPSYFRNIDDKDLLDEANAFEYLYGDSEGDNQVILYCPNWTNKRIQALQGVFLVPSGITKPMGDIINTYMPPRNEAFKMILASKVRWEFTRRLIDMNITSTTLFPGLDGYCRSFRNLLYCAISQSSTGASKSNKGLQRTPLTLRR